MVKLAPFASGIFRITSPFGWRTLNGSKDYHKGIDIVDLSPDRQITAISGGKVIQSRIITNKNNLTWQWGNYVSYRTQDGYTIYCCHMEKRFVSKGDTVEPGDVIGIMGNTGYSFGAHTHFEVRNSAGGSINAAEYLGIPNAVGSFEMATITAAASVPVDSVKDKQIMAGDRVRVKAYRVSGARKYGTTHSGGTFTIYYDIYDVISVVGERVVIGQGTMVTAAVKAEDLEKV